MSEQKNKLREFPICDFEALLGQYLVDRKGIMDLGLSLKKERMDRVTLRDKFVEDTMTLFIEPLIEEAKAQERERIIGEVEEHCHSFDKHGNPLLHTDFRDSTGNQRLVNWWQTLRGE